MLRFQSASTKWLAGIIASAALLIIMAVVINMVSDNRDPDLLSIDTPEGIVQRYLLALNEDESAEAFGYFSASLSTCTLTQFVEMTSYQRQQNFSASLGKTTTTDKATLVTVSITDRSSGDLFGNNSYSYDVIFTLKQESDGWRFSEPTWPMSWCPDEPKTTDDANREPVSFLGSTNQETTPARRRLTWNS
jgi:hypothetical protein